MYSTSQDWKNRIYQNNEIVFNMYIDDVLIDPNHILEFKTEATLFDSDLELGSTPSQYIEFKLYKSQITSVPKTIRVEYGIKITNTSGLSIKDINSTKVKVLNSYQVKQLAKNISEYEIIPIGTYNVDDYKDNNDNTITIKAYDNMIKFEFNYDGSTLTYPQTLLQVLQNICTTAGVELGSTSFLNSNKQVSVYDSSVTARTFIGYIAESAGGFAVIGRDNKLYIKTLCSEQTTVSKDLLGDFTWGDECKISKVSYEDGTRSFKFGDDTNNNLWISQDNMYIVDSNQIENIYNQLNGLDVYTFSGKTLIDPAIDLGDKIIIDGKAIIYQGELDFQTRFIADIKSTISIKAKQETTVQTVSQSTVNRRVQSQIDSAAGTITLLSEQKLDTTDLAAQLVVDYEGVQAAWNTISDYLKMQVFNNNASLCVLDKDKNVLSNFDKTGQHFYKSGETTPFGDMGVQTVDSNSFMAFSLPIAYNSTNSNGMAWGVKTTSDDVFHPILYIKDFSMGAENTDSTYGVLELDSCDLSLNGIDTSILTGSVRLTSDTPTGAMLFCNKEDSTKNYMTIIPKNTTFGNYDTISILDNISFYKNQADSNSFKIGGDTNYCLLADDGYLYCLHQIVGSSSNNGDIYVFGTITATGTINSNASDRRHKKNIKQSVENALEKIQKIKHYEFDYKDNIMNNAHIKNGYIAQEMEQIDSNYISKDKDGYYYMQLMPILADCTKAIQEQQETINKQQQQIDDLLKRIENIEKEVIK